MISGYCECGFPATHKCPKCGARVCNNHWPEHICPEVEAPEPEKSPIIESYQKKPGRPPKRK